MAHILLYYFIVPLFLFGGVYLIAKSIFSARRKKLLPEENDLSLILWFLGSFFTGCIVFMLGLLIALNIIKPPL